MKIELESQYDPGDTVRYIQYDWFSRLETGEAKTIEKEDVIKAVEFNVYDDGTIYTNYSMCLSEDHVSSDQILEDLSEG